jgi:glucan phosphoethanolaminetransferase (alkaline phosphatase superfamily)
MKVLNARWIFSIALSFIVMGLILLPEILFSGGVLWHGILSKEYLILLGICVLICISGSPRFAAGLVIIFGFMAFTEIGHLIYFGRLLSPIAVKLMFKEWAEILDTGLSLPIYFFWAFLMLILSYGTVAVMIFKLQKYLPSVPKIAIPALIFLMCLPFLMVALRSDKLFFANRTHYPIVMRAMFTYSIGLDSWIFSEKCDPQKFAIPKVTLSQPPKRDVIILMGESLSASHMSVLGYERETTPWLDQQHNNSKGGFSAGLAISAGVSTRSTLPLFFNVVRNPVDRERIARGDTNLFHLAQKNGFDTTFITAQDVEVMQGIDLRGVRVIDIKKWKNQWDKKGDLGLVDMLEEVPPAPLRFIVIQFRAPHSPYGVHSDKRPDLPRFTSNIDNKRGDDIDSYDSAVLVVDDVVRRTVERMGVKQKESYLFMTSDHAELLGNKGLWGHALLDIEVAQVPLILLAPNNDRQFWRWVNETPIPSHYQIARQIAHVLGATILDQHMDKNYFVNGPSAFGVDGYLLWKKIDGRAVELGRAANECSAIQYINK